MKRHPNRDGSLKQFIARRAASFRYAFAGIGYVLRTQPNAQIHALATLTVVMLGVWLKLAQVEWALLVLAMGGVWGAEIMNSALEALVDLVMPDPHPHAKIAKDCAAAAVLVAAGVAVVIGLLVLGPPLWAKIRMYLTGS